MAESEDNKGKSSIKNLDSGKRWDSPEGIEFKKKITSALFPGKNSKTYDFTSSLFIPDNGFGTIDKNKKDLAGIDFSGKEFDNCELQNAYFIGANFEGCTFLNVKFQNVNFDSCNFKNAELDTIEFLTGTTINGANFEGAQLKKWKGLSDDTMKIPFKYSRLRYRTILLKMALRIAPWIKYITLSRIFEGNKDYEGKKHTEFKDILMKDVNSPVNKELKQYINWYQHLLNQIEKYHERTFVHKTSLVSAILFTGYWSAYRALVFCALSLNAICASIICLCPNVFKFNYPAEKIVWNWFTQFYYCIVTFTTLGYGDITPQSWPAQIVAGFVAVAGYIILGTLIYLMSKKADNKF